jgi:hypothetical protein
LFVVVVGVGQVLRGKLCLAPCVVGASSCLLPCQTPAVVLGRIMKWKKGKNWYIIQQKRKITLHVNA